jgi:carboxylesterase
MPAEPDAAGEVIAGAETIDLQGANSCGVLLLHGFGDTPQTFRLLAEHLHSTGFGVRAPLLPGHGRSVEEFITSRRVQWVDFSRQELSAFRQRYATVGLVGLSMGGALAAVLAAENPDLPALVLMAPYIGMPWDYRLVSAAGWLWGPIAGTRKSRSPASIHDPIERAKNLGYGVYTGRLLYELWRLTHQAQHALPLIRTPTLLIQSKTDPRVAPAIAERAFASLRMADKRLVWTEGAGHVITVDYGRERVFEEVSGWLRDHMPAAVATA